jgi:hypothetical protein
MSWLRRLLARIVSPDPVTEQRKLFALTERRLAANVELQKDGANRILRELGRAETTPESPPVPQTRNDVG